jgi:hypothetical protein
MAVKLRQQLHVSGMNQARNCGIQFMFQHILGIPRPPRSHLHTGTATHQSIAANLTNRIQSGELLSKEDAMGVAEGAFDYLQQREPIEPDPDEKAEGLSADQVVGDAKDKAVNLAGLHCESVAPSIHVSNELPVEVQVSRRFSINMDMFLRLRASELHKQAEDALTTYDRKILHSVATSLNSQARKGIDLCGEMDIRETDGTTVIIRDSKTSGKSPNKSAADDSDQLSCYAVAETVLNKKLPDAVILDYLVQTPKRKDLKHVPLVSKRDAKDNQVFLNGFVAVQHAIKTGVFLPANPDWWGCSPKYCPYWDRCEYAHRPKLIQIQTAVESNSVQNAALL